MPSDTEPTTVQSKESIKIPSDFIRKVQPFKRRLEAAYAEVKNISNEGVSALCDPNRVDLFKGMFRALERYFTKFETTWYEIVDMYDGAELSMGFPSQAEAVLKSNAQKYYYQANTAFEKLNAPLSSSTSSSFINSSFQKNLPSIKVPDFNGEISQWPKFRDIYLSLVHNDDSISSSLKFQYLKTALKGVAASVIARFSIEDDANYALAWKAVTDAYDNRRMLASSYLNQVIDFKPSHGKTSSDTLQSFRSGVSDSIAAFKLLDIPDAAEFILFHLAARALDPNTREQFEITNGNVEFPTFKDLDKFVTDRCLALQLASGATSIANSSDSANHSQQKKPKNEINPKQTKRTTLLANNQSVSSGSTGNNGKSSSKSKDQQCFLCKDGSTHHLLSCRKYDEARPVDRIAWLRNWSGCINCLSPHHSVKDCKSRWHCRFCSERHHASLHEHLPISCVTLAETKTTSCRDNGALALSSTAAEGNVLLGTVVAEVEDARGCYQPIRIVVDSGSMCSFITRKCQNRLGLSTSKFPKKISGIGQTIFDGASGKTTIKMRPSQSELPELTTDAIVVNNITSFLPSVTLPFGLRSRFNQYHLADPDFWQPRPVDFLLGADLFPDICTGSTVSFGDGVPKLLSSIFGHIVIGKYEDSAPSINLLSTALLSMTDQTNLNDELKRFWELEEPAAAPPSMSPDDMRCEDHFIRTHHRTPQGRYVVRLPFRNDSPTIGDSSGVALRRFKNLERKLERNPLLQSKYREFMNEYLDLDHMAVSQSPPKFIIPHHCVTREMGSDIKVRVVFDGSVNVPPSSLNDQLLPGPKLQKDIRDILLNFRQHRYVFMTDAVKMFRMILVDEADWPYQNIYWRGSSTEAIQTYSLKTVTYGLSCAPFLALRVIKQLCVDEGDRFPLAKKALSDDIYVDDLVTGADTVEEACALQSQVVAMLGCGGFSLSKWASNCTQILEAIPTEDDNTPVQLSDKEDLSVKILGLEWDPKKDCFLYTIKQPEIIYTKRSILSSVARIFDPLGFLTPVTLQLKAFIQDLWKLGLDWDTIIPPNLQESWREAVEQLPIISQIRIPRFIKTTGNYIYQVVGFADASSKAYSAAIYLRLQTCSEVSVFLLSAKSRLAPVKTLSIPRLELCAAFLLADLYQAISGFLNTLSGKSQPPLFYSDSTIVLGWLNTPTYLLKTFVCNRVAHITEQLPISQWRHVLSEENPADLGSRGCLPSDLHASTLWWSGPSWLVSPHAEWPKPLISHDIELPELKETTVLATTELYSPFISWMSRVSSYNRLVRAVAWINRWRYNTRHANCCCCSLLSGPLSLFEIKKATTTCIKAVQLHYFFGTKRPTKERAAETFSNLSPYLDLDNVLRVGGRLANANLPEYRKHPILLPNKSHFSFLLIDHYHRAFLHPGPSQLQALIQMKFWIPSLRRLVRHRGFLCMVCYKSKGRLCPQQMGNLPRYRLEGGRAFQAVGVDFAGPFVMRESLRRKANTSKIYLSLFVCMVTKAVHLEAVTRLTTDAFIATFQRFVARRGIPVDVYSDNGTNFVGAARHLKELYLWLRDSSTTLAIHDQATSIGVKWHFNPPQTPHMGGIWESGVKSVKQRLRVIAGDTPLTFEEFSTLFARIEASLNSRPLCPVSSSPDDCDFLSPGHFLVGGPLCALPEPSELDRRMNLLDRWQINRRMHHQFWNKWRLEYLATLQTRSKWQRKTSNFTVGDLVLLKDESTPSHWPTGRVTDTHPGPDGLVRVVSIRMPSGAILKRHVSQCAPLLPLQEDAYATE